MSLIDVIKTRRSIRSFEDQPISDDDAVEILDAARLAPSGGNRQRWEFVYVKDPQVLRMVKNCSPGFYGDAAAVIVIGMEEREKFGRIDYTDVLEAMNVGFAAENILLAAHALGLGGCAIASFNESGVKKVIGAAENWRPILLVSLGHPDKVPRTPSKKTLSELVYLDRYGNRWDMLEEAD